MLMTADSAESEKPYGHTHRHACSRRKLRAFFLFSLMLGVSILVFTAMVDFFAYDVDATGPVAGSLWARQIAPGGGGTNNGTESDFTKRRCK